MSAPAPTATNLLPVAVGGDIGSYAMLRAFHERYGCDAVVVASVVTRAMADSSFVRVVVEPKVDEPEAMVAALERVAAQHPDRTLVLLTNADWYVRSVIEHRERLEAAGYLLPYCSLDVLEKVSSKEGFAEICDRLGIPTPRTVAVDVPALVAAGGRTAVPTFPVDLEFPIVGKPSSSADYYYVSFPGKKKIHHIDTRAELDELLGHLVDAGYAGTFLLQEFIPGDETQMRSLTAYRDRAGHITLLATGRVLLEEHTPGTLGIPAAILVEPYEDAMDAATRFLDEAGYVGFANFDYKLDPRTGRHVYFEMNPRVGRNNYYVTGSGANVAEAIVEDHVHDRAGEVARSQREVLYSVVPFGLLQKYVLDDALRARLVAAKKRGDVVHPLKYGADAGIKRRLVVEAVTQNYRRKYAQYYPKPTSSGY
ncbi:D-aspartate ligase [Sediminihabitans luteus]|uniref:D-aspartate ligase n=1 Tax=Sediminihabitans luteus TaxID=1138585 RepID=A0A2M9CQK3_9CELL|nr:carboxylate--amine ligase [Sediminihabitans luteus]PJJ74111.1 D-aspartate ligase [Sediminihabitans luteus]GII97974.1 carboxylate--amine ligase [Sediminihabitans luteus]